MRREDDHGGEDSSGPVPGRRDQHSFIVRLWRTPSGKDRATGDWFGEVEPVPRDHKRHFFKGLDGIVGALREILGLAGRGDK